MNNIETSWQGLAISYGHRRTRFENSWFRVA